MNSERSTGLILRTRALTETSLIVHWLTPDLGRLATVAKGARRASIIGASMQRRDLFLQLTRFAAALAWQQVFSVVGAIAVGVTAFARVTAMAATGPSTQSPARV